jgi:zinc transporter ZupT
MLSVFQWICLICIVLVTLSGGYLPLFKQQSIKDGHGYPAGQAFSAGVFLALSLTIMLPSAFHLWNKAFPDLDYPMGSVLAIVAFISLLLLEHITLHFQESEEQAQGQNSPVIPIIMTLMIAIPSFFLGAAFGVSGSGIAAIMVFVAIMLHKGSAGFALALKMAKSTLSRPKTFLLFGLFAATTPIGIFVGEDVHQLLSGHLMTIVKAVILSMAAGTFLYMSTLHELKHTPLIVNCCDKKGFILMLAGFVLTALIRFLLGEAHKI